MEAEGGGGAGGWDVFLQIQHRSSRWVLSWQDSPVLWGLETLMKGTTKGLGS